LHVNIGDKFSLPPKRILSTTFVPSAWVDDKLIAERKIGLASYLNNLLSSLDYKDAPALLDFITPTSRITDSKFNAEDALPSTLSRKEALHAQEVLSDEISAQPKFVAAGYYPYWSSRTPESLDFSKFDIIFFGTPTIFIDLHARLTDVRSVCHSKLFTRPKLGFQHD
jgi:chitinase